MALFVLSVQPMITCLQVASAAKQTWFPNDAGGTGYTTEMREWHAECSGSRFWLLPKQKEVMDYRKAKQDGKCEGII